MLDSANRADERRGARTRPDSQEPRFMPTPLPMPKLGLTMEEGAILKWRKEEGEAVEKGEIILDIQTDKVEYEVESPAGGLLLKTLAGEGDVVPCGVDVAVIGEEGEDVSGFGGGAAKAEPAEAAAPPPEPAPAAAPAPASAPASPGARPPGRVFASPAARRVARELGVDFRVLTGSGPGGRIVQADVRAAAASGAPAASSGPAAVESAAPLAGMRKIIAGRMLASWSQTPRVTLQAEVDLTNLLAVREASRQAWESDLGVRVSVNDLVIFYAARAVRRCPAVNVRLNGDVFERMRDVNLGVAVAVEEGLMVPVIRDADRKSIDAISREARALAEAARAGALGLDALEGGTFTISNLGAYGVDHFSAVINRPESAILSVGAARERAVAREGEVVVRTTAYMGVSADHRVVDGAPAAEFLATLRNMLEHPKVMPA